MAKKATKLTSRSTGKAKKASTKRSSRSNKSHRKSPTAVKAKASVLQKKRGGVMLPKNFTKTTVRHKNEHAGTSMGTKRRNMKHHMDNSNKDSLRQKRKQAVHDKARSQGHLDEEMEMMGELILNQVLIKFSEYSFLDLFWYPGHLCFWQCRVDASFVTMISKHLSNVL